MPRVTGLLEYDFLMCVCFVNQLCVNVSMCKQSPQPTKHVLPHIVPQLDRNCSDVVKVCEHFWNMNNLCLTLPNVKSLPQKTSSVSPCFWVFTCDLWAWLSALAF